jgi:hypothetical protein
MAWISQWLKKEPPPNPKQLCDGECAVERLHRFNRALEEQNIPLFENEEKEK